MTLCIVDAQNISAECIRFSAAEPIMVVDLVCIGMMGESYLLISGDVAISCL